MEFIKLHSAAKDITGLRFGRLEAVGPVEVVRYPSGAHAVRWLCRCDCGGDRVVNVGKLTSGRARSCGCLIPETTAKLVAASTKHGLAKTPEYNCWQSLSGRCTNPKNAAYNSYGGRGITVCARWMSFENFLADMGERPSDKHSIERIDNNGDYEPGNCRWATKGEQGRNRRSNFIVEAFGRKAPLIEFVSTDKPAYRLAWARIKRGWDVERAITTPSMRECA